MNSQLVFAFAAVLFTILNLANAQDSVELLSFDDISNFINTENGLISLTLHLRHCFTEDLPNDAHYHIIEDFDQWLYFDYGNGTEKFRTTKYLINELDTWDFLIIEAFSDKETRVQIQEIDPLTAQVTNTYLFFCNISDGAHFFATGAGVETVPLSNYEDLKDALISGDHVFTQSEVSACEGEDLGFARLINARSVMDTWEITNEGLPNETLRMSYDVWVDYYLTEAEVGVEKIVITVLPDGNINYMPIIFDLITWEDGFTTPEVGFQCQLGDSVRAFKRAAGTPLTIASNFEELLVILQNNHRLEVTVDAKLCEWDSPNGPYYPTIYGQTINGWSWDNVETGSSVNFVSKMVAKRDGKAYLLQQQYNVLQDGSVAVNLHSLDPITGQLLSVDSASCELSNSAIRIASVDRPRNKLLTIQELTAVQMQGRRISFFADLNDCTGEPKLIIGGTFADGSTLDRFASNGTFYGPLTELLREVDDGDDYFAWGSFNVYWFGDDNSFVVEGTVHRKPTWEVTLQTTWVCSANENTAYLYW